MADRDEARAAESASERPCGDWNLEECPFRDDPEWQSKCRWGNVMPHCPRIMEHCRLKREEADRRAEWISASQRLQKHGIPLRIGDMLGVTRRGVPPLRQTVALDAVDDHGSGFLVLCGPKGTGKTVAAAKWCWERHGLLYKAGEIAALDHFSRDGREELDNLVGKNALVIDDIGVEHWDAKGFWAARFDLLIDTRYDLGRYVATIVTSNLLPKDLQERVGPRIWDRLEESGRIVVCKGASMRRKPG